MTTRRTAFGAFLAGALMTRAPDLASAGTRGKVRKARRRCRRYGRKRTKAALLAGYSHITNVVETACADGECLVQEWSDIGAYVAAIMQRIEENR